MPIAVRCRTCGANLTVKDNFAGRTIACRECQSAITVPSGRGGTRKRRSSGGGNSGLLIGAVIGGVVFLVVAVGVGFAVVRMLGGNRADDVAFAPGGQVVDTTPAGGPPASRFDPVAPAGSGAPASAPPPVAANPSAGIGMGSMIAVTEYWKDHGAGDGGNLEILKQEPDALPAIDWDVELDPPAAPLVFAPDRKNVKVQVPNGANRATPEDIIYPVVPSSIVAVGQNATKNDTREVWDLSKPEKIGTITDLGVETQLNAVSPDGRYFAGVTSSFRNATIGVWDVAERKALVDIDLGDLRPGFLAIPRPDLLVVGTVFGDTNLIVWDLPSGRPLHEISTGWSSWRASQCAFSPGGRYLALPYREQWDDTIGLIDLTTGQVAGKLPLAVYASWRTISLQTQGLAFSPDGELLAGVFDWFDVSKVIIWRLADGEIVDHMTFDKNLSKVAHNDEVFVTATPIIWFPGNHRLLAYETAILDRELDTSVYTIPGGPVREQFPGKRRPLDESNVAVVTVTGRDGFVSVYELPEDQIAASTERVAQTIDRPPEVPFVRLQQGGFTYGNRSTLKSVARTVNGWSVQPDPAPAPSASTQPCELDVMKGTLREIGIAQTGAPLGIALRSTAHVPFTRIPSGNSDPRLLSQFRWHSRPDRNVAAANLGAARAWVDVYDLAEGKRLRELRLTYDADLVAVSSDATRCVLLENAEVGRVDVYDTGDGTHLFGCVPYANEADDKAKIVVSAALPNNEMLVTFSGGGRLTGWRIADEQQVWTAENTSQPAFSAGGRYASFSDGQNYYFIDVGSGDTVGRIPDVGDVQAVAYHPNGSRVALLSAHQAAYYIFTVDMASGEVSAPFPVPILSGLMRWCGDRYLLLDNQKLIDLEQKTVAWSYVLPEGDHVPMSPDGSQWFIANVGGEPVLSSAAIPGSAAESTLAGAALSPEFVLQPGDSCSLSIQLNHPALDASLRSSIESKFRGMLTQNKITVAQGQPVTLVVSANEKIGNTVERSYSGFGRAGDETVSLTLKTTTFRVAFESAGETAWEWTAGVGNDSMFVQHSENESIAQALERDYRNALPHGFDRAVLPPYVFSPRAANGIGTTTLAGSRP